MCRSFPHDRPSFGKRPSGGRWSLFLSMEKLFLFLFLLFLGATKHLYNWLCPSVGRSVGRVTHSFDDPHDAYLALLFYSLLQRWVKLDLSRVRRHFQRNSGRQTDKHFFFQKDIWNGCILTWGIFSTIQRLKECDIKPLKGLCYGRTDGPTDQQSGL